MVRRVWLCVGLLTAAVLAQDPNEEIRQARQTLDEFLKIGDELVRQGKHEAALKTYREAAKAYDAAMKRIAEAMRRPPLDPPANLGHLKETPADLRERIDGLVRVLMEPQGGLKAAQAKEQLAAIGKPAFPRILGAMAGVRDRITDVDSAEERLLETALKRGDECLRAIDGHLDEKAKAPVRPGTDRKYIYYILRLHYGRWNKALKDLDEMPGPYRPEVVVVRRIADNWDPPPTLGHAKATPAEQRKRIDALIDLLFDPQAGRRSLEAKQKLIAIGMPAYPAILGEMAGIRDTLTGKDTLEDRLAQSSLKLGDECLREIDPHLDEMGAPAIRVGTSTKYVRYVLRLHYRRWVEVLEKRAD